jgi:hypothetical protein
VARAQLYRPERARRSITTDQYELVIQKNSQIDLLTTGGQPLIDNAFPSITFEGGEEVPLKIDYRSTNRYSVDDPIGKGNGFHYASADCEWRIATYPAAGCLTFDLAYTNNSKKTVTVIGLSPLGVGNKGKGGVHLGGNSSDVFILQAPSEGNPFVQIGHQTGASPGHIAAWSPSTGRALVAGFLTHRRSLGRLTLGQSAQNDALCFDLFSSVCIFNTPVTVAPGERLEAETLYLSIGQQDPRAALEAYAEAAQALEPFPTKANLHGWLPSTVEQTSDSLLLENLAFASQRMFPMGWTNLNLGRAWSATPGAVDTVPQRFPQGLAPIATAAHAAGLKISAQLEQIHADTNEIERDLNKLKYTGLDVIEFLPSTSTEYAAIPSPHPLAILQLVEASTMDQPKVVYARAIAPGQFSLKDWALESRSHYIPTIGNPLLAPWARELAQDTKHFSDTQFITAFTLAAMQGGPLRPTTPWTEMSPLRLHVLSRLLPAPANSGHPLDLFQEGPPRQWYLPIHTKAGDWTIAALFNWDEAAAVEHTIPLTDLGLNNDNLYTVYDFWASQYLGLIEKALRVEVPPEGVRLLGLRRFERRPMLVASSRHYTQGASDHSSLDWVHETRTLSGTYTAVAGEPCTLSILVPEPYVTSQATATTEIVGQNQTGTLLELSIRATAGGEVQWKVTF